MLEVEQREKLLFVDFLNVRVEPGREEESFHCHPECFKTQTNDPFQHRKLWASDRLFF